MEQVNFDLFGLILAGGLATYPLLVGSVLAIAIAVDRMWAFRGTERAISRLERRFVADVAGSSRSDAGGAETAGGAGGLVLAAVARSRRSGASPEEIGRIV